MTPEKEIVENAIARDLFGPAGLTEGTELAIPEKYSLVRFLGRGGCGDVFLAQDKTLGRPVALKFLSVARPAEVERFRREARFAARLDDPAIVKIYEVGVVEGRPYIAMQFIDGTSLQSADLDRVALVRVIRTVAVALAQAHAQGIVHRDIKPSNILLDREGRTYLTDFGIARDLSGEFGATLSTDGAVIGTPALMPPEQARGDRRAVDGRSDVYSLGATLFLKLTKRFPFEGPNVVEALHAVIHDPPPFPRSIDPTIPRSLEAITLKCLQKNRDDRYASAAELAVDLDLFLVGQPVRSESSEWFRRLVGSPRVRSPRPAGADSGFGAVLEIAHGIAGWDAFLYRISTNICRAWPKLDAMIAELDGILAARPDFALARFYRGVALARRERLRPALEDMERAIDLVGDMASAHFELGRLYLALYLREHHRARQHLSSIGVADHLASARSRLAQAVLAFQEAQRVKESLPVWQTNYTHAVERLAESDYSRCVAVCDEILAADADVEEVWKLRGDALRFAGGDPFESYERALRIRRSFYEAHFAIAEAHFARRAVPEARRALGRALEICPECVDAMALLARTYLAEAQHTGAPAPLLEAAKFADAALTLDPSCYEAMVTRAEILLEEARTPDRSDRLDLALRSLDAARKMEGCPNRVGLLAARARLQRARHAIARGADPRADLLAVRDLAKPVFLDIPDNHAWHEVLREMIRLDPTLGPPR
ncbi:MAG: protein kinase [Planctomycetes bacterium]|nr:protein kinase [Planctomycetota bacterium]